MLRRLLFLRRFYKILRFSLFEQKCLGCSAYQSQAFCQSCLDKIYIECTCQYRCAVCACTAFAPQTCANCQLKPPAYNTSTALFHATGLIQKLLTQGLFSYHPYLYQWLAQQAEPYLLQLKPHFILPIPIPPAWKKTRGFNLNDEIAKRLPYKTLYLNYSEIQMDSCTQSNTHAALIKNKTILVLTDTMTTGKRLHSLALNLKQKGVKSIHNLIITRTLPAHLAKKPQLPNQSLAARHLHPHHLPVR